VAGGIANTADGLEIILEDVEERSVLRLKGRLGIDSSPDFRDRLLAILRTPSPSTIVVDLAELTYVDASGIATLLEALKIARHRQIRLCLQGLQGRPLHFFEVTGVLPLFETDRSGSHSSAVKVS
jgi:anti-sigma B factor antagonist